MGFLRFFKKRKKVVEKERLDFSKIETWLTHRMSALGDRQDVFLSDIKKGTDDLVVALKKKLEVLNQVDVDKKKEGERIRAIVKENHNNYMIHLERLIKKLDEVEKSAGIVEEINMIFSDFESRSRASYAKATYLIGKEMGDVRQSITEFSKHIRYIVDSNMELTNELKYIDKIKSGFGEYNTLVKDMQTVVHEIDDKENDSIVFKKRITDKEGEITVLKKSDGFIEEIARREKLQRQKNRLHDLISELGRSINFKALTNHYHSFPKDMTIIKNYRDDFKWSFEKNMGDDIISLLKDSRLYEEKIEKIVLDIKRLKNEIPMIKIGTTGLSEFESELSELKVKREKNESAIANKHKRIINIEHDLDIAKKELEVYFLEVNVELE